MINNNIFKYLMLPKVYTILSGSIGLFLLIMYKNWLTKTNTTEILDINLNDDFISKSTSIYLEHKNDVDKSEVELKCYSIMLILKSLTCDKSDDLYEYLDELNIKDLNGFKNFIIYLNSKLILENDKENIFLILKYFINEKIDFNYSNNENVQKFEEESNEIINNKSDFENLITNLNEIKYILNIINDADLKNLSNENLSVHNADNCQINERYEKNKKIDLQIKEISRKFIERIIDLNNNENDEMLKKVNKRERNLCSILESIFIKFLNRDFYYSTIHDELEILIPQYVKCNGNPFLNLEEFQDNIENQHASHEYKYSDQKLNEPIIQQQKLENEIDIKVKKLIFEQEVVLDDIKTNVSNVDGEKYANEVLNYSQSQVFKNIKTNEVNNVQQIEIENQKYNVIEKNNKCCKVNFVKKNIELVRKNSAEKNIKGKKQSVVKKINEDQKINSNSKKIEKTSSRRSSGDIKSIRTKLSF